MGIDLLGQGTNLMGNVFIGLDAGQKTFRVCEDLFVCRINGRNHCNRLLEKWF